MYIIETYLTLIIKFQVLGEILTDNNPYIITYSRRNGRTL